MGAYQLYAITHLMILCGDMARIPIFVTKKTYNIVII